MLSETVRTPEGLTIDDIEKSRIGRKEPETPSGSGSFGTAMGSPMKKVRDSPYRSPLMPLATPIRRFLSPRDPMGSGLGLFKSAKRGRSELEDIGASPMLRKAPKRLMRDDDSRTGSGPSLAGGIARRAKDGWKKLVSGIDWTLSQRGKKSSPGSVAREGKRDQSPKASPKNPRDPRSPGGWESHVIGMQDVDMWEDPVAYELMGQSPKRGSPQRKPQVNSPPKMSPGMTARGPMLSPGGDVNNPEAEGDKPDVPMVAIPRNVVYKKPVRKPRRKSVRFDAGLALKEQVTRAGRKIKMPQRYSD
jgi:hypothetical protein